MGEPENQEQPTAKRERQIRDLGRGKRKQVVGVVVSDKMDKTITVQVERLEKHPKYQKFLRMYTKYKAHDEKNEAGVGDRVLISETRPLSKTKRWRLLEIVNRAER